MTNYAKTQEIWEFFENALNSDTDECIEWPFTRNGKGSGYGYGILRVNGVRRMVHKEILIRKIGPCPEGYDEAAHSCHNPACINWRHLRWTYHMDNVWDSMKDDRMALPFANGRKNQFFGPENGRYKLKKEAV